MAQRVRQRREVSINSVRFPLGGDGRVHQSVSSQYPQKQVFGDIDKDSNPVTSVVVWDDFSEGVGLYSTDGKEGLRRLGNRSELETRYRGHLTLPSLAVIATDLGQSGTWDEISEHAGLLHVAVANGVKIYSWTPGSNSWSSLLRTLPATATDSLHFTLSGTEYVAFAHTGGYSYSSNGSAYTEDTTSNALLLTFWDDRLWGIDNTGQLWFSVTIGTEVPDAKLALPDGYVNRLFVGPDASGEDIIYAATEVGLYAHDAANSRFVKTKVQYPQNTDAGKAACTWNGEIYIGIGRTSVIRYDPVGGQAMLIGLDEGGAGNLLLSIETVNAAFTKFLPTSSGMVGLVYDTGGANCSIWEYSGRGWHYLHRLVGIETIHVSSAGSSYRLYRTAIQRLQYQDLHIGKINPDTETISYDSNSRYTHLPWFNAGQNDVDKLAVRLRIECTGMSSDETARIGYGLDYSSSWEASSITITGNGVTTVTFPTISDNVGEAGSEFRAIRFYIKLDRGSTATNTPNIKSLSLEWRRKIPTRYRGSMVIDHTRRYGGRSAKELKAALITAVERSTMAEVTWVDDGGNTQNYFCDVSLEEDSGESGREETGMTKITVVEN